MKITSSLFKERNIHKYTWTNRGSKSIIDYVLVNKLAIPVSDTIVYGGHEDEVNRLIT